MNKQKGAANSMLVILVVILLAAVAYFAFIKKPETAIAPATVTSTDQSTATGTTAGTPSTTTTSSGLSVPGMQQYTDTAFGFSFWYPTNWQVTVPKNPPFGAQLTGVTVVKTLGLQPSGQAYPSIIIQEAKSTQRTITDTGGAGPIGPVTYFFDANAHLWMTKNAEGSTALPANISVNTMGGLHMFGGTSRFDTTIVPLTANNFVVIGDGGAANATAVTKTIVALDPAVATPASIADQTRTIQQEMAAIAATASSNSGQQVETTIYVPKNQADYDQKVQNDQDGITPGTASLTDSDFVAKKVTVTTTPTYSLEQATADAAAATVKTQTVVKTIGFKIVGTTAYVVLNINVDGWAGVSASIDDATQVIKKTLLHFPGIKSVEVGTSQAFKVTGVPTP